MIIDELPNNLIKKSEVYAPELPRKFLVLLSLKYENDGSLTLNDIKEKPIAILNIKRIMPKDSINLLFKGLFNESDELLNFKTILKY